MNKFLESLIVCISCCLIFLATPVIAQDSVYVFKEGGNGTTTVRGRITKMTPDGVTIDGKDFPVSKIARISVGKEPGAVNRLRGEMLDGKYADCLAGIAKLRNVPDAPLLQQEIEFMKAYSTARLSLTQGTIPADKAGSAVKGFLSKYPNSMHTYSATEQFGRLAYSTGNLEAAAREFEKLRGAKWEKYQMRGQFLHGRMMSVLGKTSLAKADFDGILKQSSNSKESDQYKLLARCEQARIEGLTGSTAAALEKLNKLIKDESDENTDLFAHIYNAMGAIHDKTGNLKEARDAYLHTQLLFNSVEDEDPAAEALYRLSKIYVELKDSKRAGEAKRELQAKYRNSYWFKKGS